MGAIVNSDSSYGSDKSSVADIINDGLGIQGALNIGISAVQAKVGASPVDGRVSLTVFNNGNGTIYWGYTNTITINNGTPIFKNQSVVWSVGVGQLVWLIASTATNDTRITEA